MLDDSIDCCTCGDERGGDEAVVGGVFSMGGVLTGGEAAMGGVRAVGEAVGGVRDGDDVTSALPTTSEGDGGVVTSASDMRTCAWGYGRSLGGTVDL